MADSEENIFASDALFEEFEREDEENGEDLIPADALGELQKEINAVCEENDALKRKLRVLSAPAPLFESESVSETVGPSVQVLFMNNAIATKYRQDVEDFFLRLMQKESDRKNDKLDQAVVRPPPQRASFALQLGRGAQQTESESVESREVRQLYTVTGSVQFYQDYCVDHLGQPLIDGDAKISEGWDIPTYEQIYFDALASDGQDSVKVSKKKDKPACFNCGGDHPVRDCTQPRDHNRISQNRKLFMDKFGSSPGTPSGNRYHADLDPKFTKFKPGVVSADLMKAMGVNSHQLPPFIYQMRKLGYPPGWLAEAEETTSGLSLYSKTGKKVNEEGEEVEDGEVDAEDNNKPTYNTDKIVGYPGFNVPVPEGVDDVGDRMGLPMQPHQQREVLVSFLEPAAGRTKRPAEDDDNTTHCAKRQKRDESDMDVDTSGTDDNCIKEVIPPPPKDGIFQPPLPPTPENGTPSRQSTDDSSASESEGRGFWTEKPLPCKESSDDTNSNVENRDEIIERTIGRKDVDSKDSDAGMEDWVIIDSIKRTSESLEETSDSPGLAENASLSSADNSQDMPEDYFSPKGLPHRSKFADGITPFVEKENLTELKGTFQKLLGVLKGNKKKK